MARQPACSWLAVRGSPQPRFPEALVDPRFPKRLVEPHFPKALVDPRFPEALVDPQRTHPPG